MAALTELAEGLGDVLVVAPRDPHSYAGHRVTTGEPMALTETGPRRFHLAGTPADCVRVALRGMGEPVDVVLSGINRGGNLGADLYSSGTVAAAREGALLGARGIAVSQYIRRDLRLDWAVSARLAGPAVERILAERWEEKAYWNVNLPHLEGGTAVEAVECAPDNEPLDVQFVREGDVFRFAGSYATRPRSEGRDIAHCFGGAVTISRLRA